MVRYMNQARRSNTEKPSLRQPAELRNKRVTKSFPNPSFSTVCLSVSRSMAARGCCSSGAAACSRFGGRLTALRRNKSKGQIHVGCSGLAATAIFGILGSTDHSLTVRGKNPCWCSVRPTWCSGFFSPTWCSVLHFINNNNPPDVPFRFSPSWCSGGRPRILFSFRLISFTQKNARSCSSMESAFLADEPCSAG